MREPRLPTELEGGGYNFRRLMGKSERGKRQTWEERIDMERE